MRFGFFEARFESIRVELCQTLFHLPSNKHFGYLNKSSK